MVNNIGIIHYNIEIKNTCLSIVSWFREGDQVLNLIILVLISAIFIYAAKMFYERLKK